MDKAQLKNRIWTERRQCSRHEKTNAGNKNILKAFLKPFFITFATLKQPPQYRADILNLTS